VAPLDLQMMRDRYQVRAALDSFAARRSAVRSGGAGGLSSGCHELTGRDLPGTGV
jgi:hypothetical protein